jgi:TolB-like protein
MDYLRILRMARFFPLVMLLVTACSFGPGNIQLRHSSDLESRRVRRIAVLPPGILNGDVSAKPPLGTTPAPRSAAQDAPEALAHMIYTVMASMPNWQIISDAEVREVSQSLPAGSEAARFRRIGETVYADAVIVGRVQRYRERVGDEWGAKSPASVAFVLDLIDVRRGDVIWSARFDETQKSLSENIFAIGEVGQRGVRWLSAAQLAQEGVKKAVAQLHDIIARTPIS